MGLFLGPLGAFFLASRGSGACLGPVGGPGGLSGDLLGPPVPPLGPVLGLSWGRLGGLLDRLGASLGAYWAVLNAVKAEKARMPQTLKHLKIVNDFWLLGAFLGGLLEASWRPLGPSWGHLGRLGAIFGRLGALLERLGSLLGPSWPVLGPSWARRSHAARCARAQGARGGARGI